MKSTDICGFARLELEAVPDRFVGSTYRCAAYLEDGVYLPCVLLVNRERTVEESVRRMVERLEDGRKPPNQQRFGNGMRLPQLIALYRTAGSRVDAGYIARLEPSPYAIPDVLLRKIDGETSMSWTQFVAAMADGAEFAFGTNGDLLFSEMPRGYMGKDVISLRPHETLRGKIYRRKPFFICYVDGLE